MTLHKTDKTKLKNLTINGKKISKAWRNVDNTHANSKLIYSSGPSIMYVSDQTVDKILAYDFASKSAESSSDFNTLVAAGNNFSAGLFSDGTTLWVCDTIADKAFAYNLSTKAYESAKDVQFGTLPSRSQYTGIWSDGTTMWASRTGAVGAFIEAYTISTGARDNDQRFALHGTQGVPRGIWSDGETMWVINDAPGSGSGDRIYAYKMSDKSRDASKEFNTLNAALNNSPWDLWSDGETMWVSDTFRDKIYAYNMSTKARDVSKDFNSIPRHPNGIFAV